MYKGVQKCNVERGMDSNMSGKRHELGSWQRLGMLASVRWMT